MIRRYTMRFLLGSLLFEGTVKEAWALQPVGSVVGDESPTLKKGRPPVAEAARLWGRARHRQPTDTNIRKGLPPTPGCYMRMISECPSQPMRTLAWRRDTWADQRGVDEAGCHRRKSVWDKYCGAEDAEMLYVGGRAGFGPDLTAEALQAPTYPPPLPVQSRVNADSDIPMVASPKTYSDGPVAQGDEEEEEAPPSLPPPMVASPKTYSDISVAQAPPTPTGSPPVPIQPRFSTNSGIPTVASPMTNSDIPVARDLKTFTGHDSDVLKGYPSSSQPGCYLRTPSGCPAKPMKTRLWRHDLWAEQHKLNETGCKERKRVWDNYCEVDDVKVLFVPG